MNKSSISVNKIETKIGDRFERLTVIAVGEPYVRGKKRWICRCDCGKEILAHQTHLRQKRIVSCGCLRDERHVKATTTHGKSRTKTYQSWNAMGERCRNIKHKGYMNYGGRGIKVCDRWKSFENFVADMGERPEGKTLDRLDVNGDYEPSNCAWKTHKEQHNNRRNNRYLTLNGETKSLQSWCDEYKTSRMLVDSRLRYGWDLLTALTTPPLWGR